MAKKEQAPEQILKVRVNAVGYGYEEVVITGEEPYVNRVVYAKPGVFKDGELGADEVAKLEAKSNKALDEEHAAKLEAEKTAVKKEEG